MTTEALQRTIEVVEAIQTLLFHLCSQSNNYSAEAIRLLNAVEDKLADLKAAE